MEQNRFALPSTLTSSIKQKGGENMSASTQERVLPVTRPLVEKNDHNRVSKIDLGKVKIVPLPRRNDEIYMRGLRRRRA